MKNLFYFFCCFFILANTSQAQTIPNFTLENVSLANYSTKSAVVVIFTSSHCSFATQYVNRLNNLYNSYNGQNVAFIAINSNDATMSPSEDGMVMKAVSIYQFPYLKDELQKVARLFNAEKTPEAFILKPVNGQFQVMYRGAIDDNPINEKDVRTQCLQTALKTVLSGGKPNDSGGMGCPIKWLR